MGKESVEALDNTLLINTSTAGTTGRHLAQTEHTLDHAQFGGGGVQTGDGEPVVDDQTGADDGRAAVNTAGDERHLQQRGKLILIADRGLGVHDTALVGEGHVRPR